MPTQGFQQVQKQTQSMVLAPQLRQSLKILQVPAIELRSAILEELAANPTLEEMSYDDVSLEAPGDPTERMSERTQTDDFNEPEPVTQTATDNLPESTERLDFTDEYAVLNKMGEDW